MLNESKTESFKIEFRKKLSKFLSKGSECETKREIVQKFSDKRISDFMRSPKVEISTMNEPQKIVKPVAMRPKKTDLDRSAYRLSTCDSKVYETFKNRESKFIDQRASLRETRNIKSQSICSQDFFQSHKPDRPFLNLMKNFNKSSEDDDVFDKINQLNGKKTNRYSRVNDDVSYQQFKIDLNQIENDSN
ncbi:unnamed protein product [Brachionus calyciflorus]|uniref:Uncharacterized protein n=1 Tax=Brachionus calyciflorus TaxID=104777 RepID=A0A814JZZ1_9BILA|nr:unnamed protein product [Brachionus calyciflorus]